MQCSFFLFAQCEPGFSLSRHCTTGKRLNRWSLYRLLLRCSTKWNQAFMKSEKHFILYFFIKRSFEKDIVTKGQGKTARSNLFSIENAISIKYSECKYGPYMVYSIQIWFNFYKIIHPGRRCLNPPSPHGPVWSLSEMDGPRWQDFLGFFVTHRLLSWCPGLHWEASDSQRSTGLGDWEKTQDPQPETNKTSSVRKWLYLHLK